MHKFLETARQLALEHAYEPHLEYRLCSVLVRGGKVLSVGYNHPSNHTLVRTFKKERAFCNSLHAEADAVRKAFQKISDISGSKMYTIRLSGKTDSMGPALARPCSMCQSILKSYGVKRAIYSIDPRTYGVMNMTVK